MAPKTKGKTIPSPSLISTPSSAIEDLFSALDRHIQKGNYSEVVKVADQVLTLAPDDEDALRCKVVALIKSDNIDGAFLAIPASEGHHANLSFYKAYCLYRQNKLFEALECLKCQERNDTVVQLESQILYRLGRMDDCVESYKALQKSKTQFSSELTTNMLASLILAGRSSEVQQALDTLKVKPSSSYDIAYNVACSFIERKDYVNAKKLLLTAKRIGQETLMDSDYADDEIEIELAPITVQLAHVQQMLGHYEEAAEAYTEVINRNLADRSSLAIATNNLIALKGVKDVSNGLRKLSQFMGNAGGSSHWQLTDGLNFKLSPRQKEAIYTNLLLLLLHARKFDQAREVASLLQVLFPDSVMPILLQAAILVRENKPGKAEEMLYQSADKFPDKSTPFLLARAQVAATAGHHHVAAESLLRISEIEHMPATVATVVSLKERYGDISGAVSIFEAAIRWWTNAMSEDNNTLNLLMKEAALFNLKHGLVEEAARLYEELIRSDGSDQMVAGLVKSVAHVNVDKAEYYKKRLRPLPGLKEINLEKLEVSQGARPVDGSSKSIQVAAMLDVKKGKIKKKRKRKPRYPKGFDPSNPGPPPDPERWLPKRERSTYRPKRKDKRAAHMRGSQGAVVREKHDASASLSNDAPSLAGNRASSSKGGADKGKSSSKLRKKSRR